MYLGFPFSSSRTQFINLTRYSDLSEKTERWEALVATFKCCHCHRERSANPRLKGRQSYCGDPPCQRARKADWKRLKLAEDPDYRLNHIEGNRSWRRSNPHYWRTYRQKNLEKAKRNRLLQKLRRIKAGRDLGPKGRTDTAVAKVDALFLEKLQVDRMFWLVPAVAKVDAFLVEISSISAGCEKLQRSTRSS